MANKKISELQSRTPALSDLMLVGDPSSGYSYKCTVTALATIIETDIADGYVTIGTTQTISGAKTFSNNLTLTSVANATTTQTKFLTLNASNVVNYRTGAEVLADIGGASSSSISGTTNYVAKFTSSSAIGNSAIYSNTSGNVSIGNTNDAYKLDVSGTVRSTSNFVVNNGTVVGNYAIETAQVQIGTFSNHPFVLTTFNTERVRIDTSGNVTFSQIANATIDTDKFLVSDSGVLKYRTGAELLSDIGGASAALYVPYTGATTNVNLGTRTITANGVYSTEGIYVANTYGLYGRNAANNAYNLLVGITGQDKVYIDGSGSGTIMNGTLTLSVINNATVDTDTFLVADSGVIKYRTGTQLLSDIGAASSSSISGTTNYIPKFTSSSAIGNSAITDNGSITTSLQDFYVSKGNAIMSITSTNTGGFSVLRLQSSGISDLWFGRESSTSSIFGLTPSSSVIYSEGAHPFITFVNGSERMRLDASGNLYLNTTSGTGRLVIAQSNATQPAITLTTDESTIQGPSANTKILMGGNLSMYGANILTFGTGTTERARIDASGNLGLGVSPSAWASGQPAIQIGGTAINNRSSVLSQFSSNQYWNGANHIYITTGTATLYTQNDGAHSWATAVSGTAGNAISFTQAMTLFSTGNLAVGGTSDNGYRVTITSTSGAQLELRNSANNKSWRPNVDGSDFAITETGVGVPFIIKAGGNVGIGTTSPSTRLDVNGVGTFQTGFQVVNGGTGLSFAASRLMGQMELANMFRMYITGQDASTKGALEIYNATSTGSPTIGLAITASSNVGIGTTSPGNKLTVNGDIAILAGNGIYFNNSVNTANSSIVCPGGGSMSLRSYGADMIGLSENATLVFSTNSSERMRITSGGELLINTTSDAGDYKLQVNGDGYFTGASVKIALNATSVGAGDLVFNNAGTQKWNLTSVATSYDMRLYNNGGINDYALTIKHSTGAAEFYSSIKTGAPSGGTAAAWKLGERVASSSLTLNTTQYIQLDINGTLYTLATVNLS